MSRETIRLPRDAYWLLQTLRAQLRAFVSDTPLLGALLELLDAHEGALIARA